MALTQFLGCFLVGLISGGELIPRRENISVEDLKTAYLPYIALSFLVFCGTGVANIAVGYVQYPVKVVFKSSKLVPVMVVSVIMRNSRSYSWIDYSAAVLICAGTVGFAWDAKKLNAENAESETGASFGIGLLIISMLADALVVNVQQRMMQRERTDPNTMMARLNLIGFLGVASYQVFSGQMDTLRALARSDPMLWAYVVGVGATLGFAILAYTNLVNEAGSVFAVGVATLRKVFTVILSYLVFPKALTWIHVVAGLTTFAGLVLSETRTKKESKDSAEGEKKPLTASAENSKV
jgi:adenosine 3'-phospho 5'-phosphosulfate transporter B3